MTATVMLTTIPNMRTYTHNSPAHRSDNRANSKIPRLHCQSRARPPNSDEATQPRMAGLLLSGSLNRIPSTITITIQFLGCKGVITMPCWGPTSVRVKEAAGAKEGSQYDTWPGKSSIQHYGSFCFWYQSHMRH